MADKKMTEAHDIITMGKHGLGSSLSGKRSQTGASTLKNKAQSGKSLSDFMPAGWGKKSRTEGLEKTILQIDEARRFHPLRAKQNVRLKGMWRSAVHTMRQAQDPGNYDMHNASMRVRDNLADKLWTRTGRWPDHFHLPNKDYAAMEKRRLAKAAIKKSKTEGLDRILAGEDTLTVISEMVSLSEGARLKKWGKRALVVGAVGGAIAGAGYAGYRAGGKHRQDVVSKLDVLKNSVKSNAAGPERPAGPEFDYKHKKNGTKRSRKKKN